MRFATTQNISEIFQEKDAVKPAPYFHTPSLRACFRHSPLACVLAIVIGGIASAAAQQPGLSGSPDATESARARPELWPALRSPLDRIPRT